MFFLELLLFQRSIAATAAKSLQSCPTLCDLIDGGPPGSPVPGILQARALEWAPLPSPTMTGERGAKAVRATESLRNLQGAEPGLLRMGRSHGGADDNLCAHSWATGWQRECPVWAKLGEGSFRQVSFG